MQKIYLNNPDSNGCTLYRSYWPWKHCRDELATRDIDLVAGGVAAGIPPDASHDAFVFGRAPYPSDLPLFYFLKKGGKQLAWDLEDNYFRIPETFSCYKASVQGNTPGVLAMCLDIADRVTVITDALREFIETECPYTKGRIDVLPNLIDVDAYPVAERRSGPPRVLWAGGNSHGPDLAAIVPVFEWVIEKTDATLVFMGDFGTMPEALLKLPPERCLIYGWSSARHYPAVLCDMQPDIALIPVTGTEFDKGKSAIKWMETTLAGAAVVATDFGPYADAIEHDRTGVLIPPNNTPDAWVAGIEHALAHRERLHAAARAEVVERHSWQAEGPRRRWVEFFAGIVG